MLSRAKEGNHDPRRRLQVLHHILETFSTSHLVNTYVTKLFQFEVREMSFTTTSSSNMVRHTSLSVLFSAIHRDGTFRS